MLSNNLAHACQVTGFVPQHAAVCESVAQRVNCIILFREPGVMAQSLIADSYAMKGFRIDTKSCDWGPMSGFVCMDPRLTKNSAYEAKNRKWTSEALTGHIVHQFFGDVADLEWKADIMPIVISRKRIQELIEKKAINPKVEGKDYVGESTKDSTMLCWRLVPATNATNKWLQASDATLSEYYVLCVNNRVMNPFKQEYPSGVKLILFRGHETILGLINPGTHSRGFKACVTADYDLLSVWPKTGNDRMSQQHNLSAAILNRGSRGDSPLPGNVTRLGKVDQRLQSGGHREHHRFGDVNARILNIKVLLNSALQGAGGYKGGNAIHHNDEAGNFALAKSDLKVCLPVIGFVPGTGGYRTVLIQTEIDFKQLALFARMNGFTVFAKDGWI